MKKRFWHELSDSTIRRLLKKGVTWGYIMNRYKQPKWCSYPDALEGVMGCWSLIDFFDSRHKISLDYCSNCDCSIMKEANLGYKVSTSVSGVEASSDSRDN